MNPKCLSLSLVLASSCAWAQPAAAPYNEAVHFVGGRRVVDVAPVPSYMRTIVEAGRRPDSHPPGMTVVQVVETPQGLMDCNMTWWYSPKSCSPSTFGKEIFGREWMVEMHGQWYGCVGRAKPVACIPLLGDGKLRGLPTPVEE